MGDGVVCTDKPPGHTAEPFLELVRTVHRVVLSADVHGYAAEIKSACAPFACFDDAPPEERVGRIGGAAGIIRRSGLVDLTLATSPGERTRHRLAVSLREANTRVARSEEHTSELQSRGHLVCRL